MKKKLVASLAAAMVLGVAGTSFAATNPFVDVPAKHWSYQAVSKLAEAGIVTGYGDNTFQGDKVITRYEMAQIVATAMAREDKATAEQKAAIDKLAAEYRVELEGLNVRMTAVENRLDNMSFSGEVRSRFEHKNMDGTKTNQGVEYLDLYGTAQIDDNWKAIFEVESTKTSTGTTTGVDGHEGNTSKIYAQGSIDGVTAKIGQFGLWSQQGLIFDDKIDGAELSFGKVLKTDLYYGKAIAGDTNYKSYTGIAATYPVSNNLSINAGYHALKGNAGITDNNIWEAGLTANLGQDFSLAGNYAKSDLDDVGVTNKDKEAYVIALNYKGANTKVVHSYGATVSYLSLGADAAIAKTFDMGKNLKGYTAELYYVPAKNIKLGALYYDGKVLDSASTTAAVDTKFYRGQLEFFF